MTKFVTFVLACLATSAIDVVAFTMPHLTVSSRSGVVQSVSSFPSTSLFMSDNNKNALEVVDPNAPPVDPMEYMMGEVDEATRKQMEKAQKAQLLREQEVFMKKGTGVHRCTNCDWKYDETKGDSMMIGGMIKPGTKFENLPADWRCPVCRASKDAFAEVVEEIPGFEVNQGYGFGTNSWTAGQKNLAIFGGLGFFFLLFLSGYAMS
jgi:rubredoxin